jgi:hypothetical protein
VQLKGVVKTLVLLVDFPDQAHAIEKTPGYYKRMLFSLNRDFATGSMREYFRGISNFKPGAKGSGIDVQGEVHGWFRMPQPLSFYAGVSHGMEDSFRARPDLPPTPSGRRTRRGRLHAVDAPRRRSHGALRHTRGKSRGDGGEGDIYYKWIPGAGGAGLR